MDSTSAEKEGQGKASMKRKMPEEAVNVKQEPVERENEEEDEDEEDEDDEEEEEEEDNSDDDDNTLITVRIDRNILGCPVCHKPLKSPLYQVKKFHCYLYV